MRLLYRVSRTSVDVFVGYMDMTFQINQLTRCNNFSSLLLDDYVQINKFRVSSRPSSGAQQLQ